MAAPASARVTSQVLMDEAMVVVDGLLDGRLRPSERRSPFFAIPFFRTNFRPIAVSATTKKVFVAGLRTESTGATTWIVRGSVSGTSFNLNHTFSLGGSSRATASLSDHSGNIFVAGEAIDGSGTPHWVIRRSADNGASWSNVMGRIRLV